MPGSAGFTAHKLAHSVHLLMVSLSAVVATPPAPGDNMSVSLVGQGGYPRGLQLAGGGPCLVCAGMNIYLSDNRQTWHKISTVRTDTRAGVDLANCNLAQLSSGRVLASYRHHVPLQDGAMRYSIQISASDDNGSNWFALSTVTSGPIGMWEPFLWPPDALAARTVGTSPDMIWVAYAQELTNGGLQSIVWQRSTNGGASWEVPRTISDGREHNSRDGMPGITHLCDGSLLLVFEGFWDHFAHNGSRHHFSVSARRSTDGGHSWSAGEVVFAPGAGAKGINAGSPQVIASSANPCNFFVSFLSDEHIGTASGHWVANAEAEVLSGCLLRDHSNGASYLLFNVSSRFVAGPQVSLWPGLSHFDSSSYVLFGNDGKSYSVGPLENR